MRDVTRYVIVGDGAIAPEWPEADPVRNRFVLASDHEHIVANLKASLVTQGDVISVNVLVGVYILLVIGHVVMMMTLVCDR